MSVREKTATATRRKRSAGVLFVCEVDTRAKAVYVVGEFNNWDPTADRMVRRGGVFQKKLTLNPGEYQYKFIVDGEWFSDPSAEQVPNEFGTMNSIVRV